MVTFEAPMRQALDFFIEYIGPYPYEKLAACRSTAWAVAWSTPAPCFTARRKLGIHRPAFSLVAHEVSHQWWGDSVTEKDWDDAWLSEGFATYFAALALEHDQGHDAFLASMARSRSAILQMEKKAAVPVIHDNLADIRNWAGSYRPGLPEGRMVSAYVAGPDWRR